MKAMIQDVYGSVDVIKPAEIDTPIVGDEDVLVRVHAAGVDAGVWHIMAGLPYLVRLGFGLKGPRVRVRGLDVAGRVERVGKNVTRFRVGDDVFGTCDGAFAEYAAARHDRFALKPAGLSFDEAAALPISATTALKALRDKGQVRPGQKVLIIGAAGGVGTYAVQIAKAFGAEVTGVCSTTKMELVRSIGADHVIDHTQADFADGVHYYDVILDIAGNRSIAHLRRALAPLGTLVLVGGEGGGRWLGGMERQLGALMLSPFTHQRLTSLLSLVRNEDLHALIELVEAGKLKPVIEKTFPLSGVPDAIRHLEAGHARGKVVIAIA